MRKVKTHNINFAQFTAWCIDVEKYLVKAGYIEDNTKLIIVRNKKLLEKCFKENVHPVNAAQRVHEEEKK